ncbi:MAG TPA: SAM-dependent chlorinase/fluorinase [Verrucomicrobiae bacterium]|nr:SAM-dependent chlorinase/fluorinase [Verrucomicrobiae bacterium]
MADSIVTLTTDFGTNDHLVAAMKGVILNINPAARIVDISHNVTPYDILDGALCVGNAYKYFPSRTIHVVIVDPGVGTDRRPILVSGEKQFFVAPDNGILSMVFEREACTVRHITAEHYFLNPVSPTFHGRDIFAPTAGWLSKTLQTEAFGEVITDHVRFAMPKAKAVGQTVKGVILRVDAFGNLMTNLTEEEIPIGALDGGPIRMAVNGKQVQRFARTFASGNPGEPIAVVGSAGYIEIAVNRGNAARTLGANRGTEVTLDVT